MFYIKNLFLIISGIIGSIFAFMFFKSKSLDAKNVEIKQKVEQNEIKIQNNNSQLVAEGEKREAIKAEAEQLKKQEKSDSEISDEFNKRYQ